jgi:uncharacterized protein YkwD
MPDWIQWLNENWKLVIIPVVVFAVFIIGGLWLRRAVYDKFNRWAAKTKKVGLALFVTKLHGPFLFWFILLGAYVAIKISILTIEIAGVIDTALLSLFVASWIWVAVSFSGDIGMLYLPLLRQYLAKARAPQPPTRLAINGLRTVFIIIGLAILFNIWKLPNVAGILILATALTIGILALREAATRLSKRFHFTYRTQKRLKSVGKVLLTMSVVTGIADIIRRIYLLSSSGLDTTVSLIILFLEMGFVMWFIHILRSSNLRRARPSFKLVTALFITTVVILAFSGIQPMSMYKDNLVNKWESYRAAQEAARAEKVAEAIAMTPMLIKEAPPKTGTESGLTVTQTLKVEEAEREAFRLINAVREEAGVSPTKWSDELYDLSKKHTQEMADRGELFHTPMGAEHGENAWGGQGYYHYQSEELAKVIVSSWMSSPLHRAWLLHPPIEESVVSIVVTEDGQYASWSFWIGKLDRGPELVEKVATEWRNSGSGLDWIPWLISKGYLKY